MNRSLIILVVVFGLAASFDSTWAEDNGCPQYNSTHCIETDYPYETNCSLFWKCNRGCVAEVLQCPDGTHFSPIELTCLYPEDANCQAPVVTDTFSCPMFNSSHCYEEDYPHATDCTAFWKCDPACNADLFDCPANLHFSPTKRLCEYPGLANCEDATPVTTTTTTTTTTTQPTTTTTTTQPTTTTMPDTTMTTSDVPSTTTMEPTTTTETTTMEPTTTTETTTTAVVSTTSDYPPTSGPSLFFVARVSSIRLNRDPLPYEAGYYLGNDFDASDFSFTAPAAGFYFFSICAGYEANEPGNMRMEPIIGDSPIINMRRNDVWHNDIDMGCRDIIFSLNAGDKMRTTQYNNQGRLYSSSTGLETSWMGISFHGLLNVSTFSVGRQSSYSTVGPVDFTRQFVNTGEWDGQKYTAPISGTYFFSISSGAAAFQRVEAVLKVNGATVAGLYKHHTDNNNIVTFSRVLIINLNVGDEVTYELESGSMWGNTRYQISFSGFYAVPHNTVRYAWSVSRTTYLTASLLPYQPVQFDDVLVNEGSVYNVSTHTVTIPRNGFYYFSIGAGALPNEKVDMSVAYRGGSLIRVIKHATNHQAVDTTSRGAIMYFYLGDKLTVKIEASTSVYGDDERRLTSFQGFLLYAKQQPH